MTIWSMSFSNNGITTLLNGGGTFPTSSITFSRLSQIKADDKPHFHAPLTPVKKPFSSVEKTNDPPPTSYL